MPVGVVEQVNEGDPVRKRQLSLLSDSGHSIHLRVWQPEAPILDDRPQALRKQETADEGAAILEHVMGDKRAGFISSVSRATGLEPDQVSQLFALLAPVVLGALGQIQRKHNLDPQGVSNLLEKERSTVQATSARLVQLLDMDGDGDVSEEVVTLGANLLGGLFGKKGQSDNPVLTLHLGNTIGSSGRLGAQG